MDAGTRSEDAEPLVDRWKRDGQTYQLGQNFGQGGYGTYGAERRNAGRARLVDEPASSEPAEAPVNARATHEVASEVASDEQGLPAQPGAVSAAALMTSRPRCASVDTSVADVAAIMKVADCGIVPIVDEREHLVGVVTDRDIVVRACAAGQSPKNTRAGDVMSREVETARPDDDVRSILARMAERQVRRIPVVAPDRRVLGVIAMADIANHARWSAEHDHRAHATLGQKLERTLGRTLEEISSPGSS